MEWNTSSSSSAMEKFLIDKLEGRESFSLEDKVDFTASIIDNCDLLLGLQEADREECELALIGWVWRARRQLQEDNYQSELLRDLLFNILIIFESIPLGMKDITSLKLIEKLRAIGRLIKADNVSIACRVTRLTDYWEGMLRAIKEEEAIKLLQRKRARADEESEVNDEDTDCNSVKGRKKRVSWKENLVEVLEFCP